MNKWVDFRFVDDEAPFMVKYLPREQAKA